MSALSSTSGAEERRGLGSGREMEEDEVDVERRATPCSDGLLVGDVIEEKDEDEEEEDEWEWTGPPLAVDGRVGGRDRGETVVTCVLLAVVCGEPVWN